MTIVPCLSGAILHWIHFLPHYKTVPEPPCCTGDDLLRRRDKLDQTALQISSYQTRPERQVGSAPVLLVSACLLVSNGLYASYGTLQSDFLVYCVPSGCLSHAPKAINAHAVFAFSWFAVPGCLVALTSLMSVRQVSHSNVSRAFGDVRYYLNRHNAIEEHTPEEILNEYYDHDAALATVHQRRPSERPLVRRTLQVAGTGVMTHVHASLYLFSCWAVSTAAAGIM